MTFESDVNANRLGGNLRGAVREAVGIFASRDALQKAVDDLTLAGFQRHELSVLANDETIRDHLGHVPQRAEDIAHDPDAPRQSYVSPEDVGSVKGVAVGIPAHVGAILATGAVLATRGKAPGAAAAAAAGGGGGGGVGVGMCGGPDGQREEAMPPHPRQGRDPLG
ncbi:hypothetical protein GAY31_27450, partial [Azospirillum brasilense]|nr:hypothetical protein [Azospirillum brasilense]